MKNRFAWADRREIESIISTGTGRDSVAIQAALESKLISLGIEPENADTGDPTGDEKVSSSTSQAVH